MNINATRKVCIAGKNDIAVYGLRLLLEYLPNNRLYCVINETDSGHDTWQLSVQKEAIHTGVQIVTLEECYKMEDLLFISLEYDKIIKPDLFTSNELFNIHFSKLPAYKGMYTSSLPLLYGEKESGVTLHRIDTGIDTGEIVDQKCFDIQCIESARELYFCYLKYAKEILACNIDNLLSGRTKSYPQPAEGSSYFSKDAINYSKSSICLTKSAIQIRNQIRSLMFREYQVPHVLNYPVINAKVTNVRSTLIAGKLCHVNANKIIISTTDFNLEITRDNVSDLMTACCTNDITLAKISLNNLIDINVKNKDGLSPLMLATSNGSIDLLRILLHRNADVYQTDYKGCDSIAHAKYYYEKTGDKNPYKLLNEHCSAPGMATN